MSMKLQVRSEFTTRYQPSVRYAALVIAWVKGLTFTVQGLAGATGKPVTSNMRKVLAQMTLEGELHSFIAKDHDGKWKRYYCAHKTEQIKWRKEDIA